MIYSNFEEFIFRAPVFPYNTECQFSYRNKIFLEAIQLVSKDLYEAVINDKDIVKTEKSLLKYRLRSHYRPTPFGYFAGVGIGNFGNSNYISLCNDHAKTSTTLDMYFICSLIRYMESEETLMRKLDFNVNNSLYRVGKDFRYVDYSIKNGRRSYFISEIEADEILEFIVSNCNGKSRKIDEIISLLKNEFNVGEDEFEEVDGYIKDLIKNQVLTSNLTPKVNNGDILGDILNLLGNEITNNNKYVKFLSGLNSLVKEIDTLDMGYRSKLYEKVQNEINNFSKENSLKFNKEYYTKTDLFLKTNKSELSTSLLVRVNESIKFLNKITPRKKYESIDKFKRDFYQRYENNFIPLTIVMDTDLGLGISNLNAYSTDKDIFIDDLLLGSKKNIAKENDYILTKLDKILYCKFLTCIEEGKEEIILEEEEFKDFEEDWSDLPNTMSVFVEVIKLSRSNEKEPRLVINSVHGSSALNMISRFSKLDNKIEKAIQKIVKKEEELISENQILAELVHLPEDRTGNIILRKVERKYEIPYLALSNINKKFQIDINDILVTVPNGEKIILWSKKFNKEIVPIHSCAYNYMINKLPIFHFLALVQNQGKRQSLSFNWGNLYYDEPFLPRVTYKNIILSPKVWRITKNPKYNELLKKDFSSLKFEIIKWRERNGLPEKFLLADGDNRLLIDTNNNVSIEIIFKEIAKGDVLLHEYFSYEGDSLISKDNGETYKNEVIINYYKNEK